ncbi:MAG: DUF2513 domain-containing protein [Comamonadaceae bacterium]|nr:MAG: DUF2513 domain-containing protein [Comamonadaceae bacterium]
MKRDMDLARRILLATEALEYGKQLKSLPDVPPEQFVVHVIWLKEAGLLDAVAQAGSGSGAKFAIVQRLTWAGCEFVDAARNDSLWAKAKDNVIKPGMSFSFDVLKEWLKAEITQGLPTLRGLA